MKNLAKKVMAEFNRLENNFQDVYIENNDYTNELKKYLGSIDPLTFNILYFDEVDLYLKNPKPFHLENDTDYINFENVYYQLKKKQ